MNVKEKESPWQPCTYPHISSEQSLKNAAKVITGLIPGNPPSAHPRKEGRGGPTKWLLGGPLPLALSSLEGEIGMVSYGLWVLGRENIGMEGTPFQIFSTKKLGLL